MWIINAILLGFEVFGKKKKITNQNKYNYSIFLVHKQFLKYGSEKTFLFKFLLNFARLIYIKGKQDTYHVSLVYQPIVIIEYVVMGTDTGKDVTYSIITFH